ncbi:maleylpyruvate isomerase N-terminal domain-containing protein [Aquipuribacter nitratireducens]|uniref:Maleylpyruvate isomerase N-terminal domain-containing protein n=1 Tax=Aquipuribacter nitratireducens TaxID=650104 RepID=A0ABW0GQA7_9MICO
MSEAFLAGARAAHRLVASSVVGDRWSESSVLPGMSTGELAAHLARAVLQVDAYRSRGTSTPVTTDAVGYFADLAGTAEPDSVLNVGVRERAAASAADGHGALVGALEAALVRLGAALPTAPRDEVVVVGHRRDQVLLLSEYLRTRCVELAVHLEDLALSVDAAPEVPAATVGEAVDLLQAAARRRYGDAAVLRALARRERDTVDAARVL